LAFTGEPVARLPGQIAEQHIHLEVLLKGLPFEEGRLKGFAKSADRIGEDVVEHAEAMLLANLCR
jgi:hypothetical protein